MMTSAGEVVMAYRIILQNARRVLRSDASHKADGGNLFRENRTHRVEVRCGKALLLFYRPAAQSLKRSARESDGSF